ncbi:hypothetical protein HHI36_014986 [Cryptolaemus montrouzieri]|uniref:Uncharacterized protein n=1 Tax=Cryptolaemus montrouzieri TaxID=559131 RepID=A0ABD2N4C9_9CUCU
MVEALELKDLFDEIIKTRTELKNSISSGEEEIILKNFLEKNAKKNSLIVLGLNKKPTEVTVNSVRESILTLVEVNIAEEQITDLYHLGKTVNCPVKVEFGSYLKKKEILSKCSILKKQTLPSHTIQLFNREKILVF